LKNKVLKDFLRKNVYKKPFYKSRILFIIKNKFYTLKSDLLVYSGLNNNMKVNLMFLITCISFLGCSSDEPEYHFQAEARGVWLSPSPEINWDSTMMKLNSAGFNMVFPFMCSSGMAYYPSDFLPMKGDRDELALCLDAAHRYGIEVHVWKNNWNLNGAPEESIHQFEKEERIQISYDNQRVPPVSKALGWNQKFDWLCPANPANRELEKNVMFELVKKYDVDGVHSDYMRYPYEPFCYCRNCEQLFRKDTGLEIDKWPDDVWKEGKYRAVYLEWRAELITSSAEEIAGAIHDYDPYVCVSLAARSGIRTAFLHDGQEWWTWDDKGILDFVCPMNYTADPAEYLSDIQNHLPLLQGNIPYYGGIGLFLNKRSDMLIESIRKGRAHGQDGFVVFSYGWGGLSTMLDTVGIFLNQDRKVLLPHRAPLVSFYIHTSPRQTKAGLPGYPVNDSIDCEVVIPLKAKIRQGITRIRGYLKIQQSGNGFTENIMPVNIRETERFTFILNIRNSGIHRIILSGEMELSDGLTKPFVSESYPFILL
jgi:uncharacterized lipoprotein YddW (UPF0748 family)